ncbi:IS1380 family transposase [Bradyrhizobium barranii subsp. apii]|uniref:IS1380 family transposase n=1 Tax=Bradyrhizobium barranii subsp. apii TaxID=2819348 RepID=A0A8T5V600_9BRAD|nr:IS1380 family transposase [Bradyrhizobium barranii]UPT87157.1 IS1380 family transposase [Bradyrhizobium barranii subsp. apii]
MTDDTILPFSFPAVHAKKVTAAFDGGRLTSNGGVMLLAMAERRLGLVDNLARVFPDRRDPTRVVHSLVDMFRARMFAICCGYEDADDLDHLRSDPAFKLACGRLPDTGRDLCSNRRCRGWRMLRAFDAWMDSYPREPASVTLDIDDTCDVVHGHQQLSLFNAHYDERCFLPIYVYDTEKSRPVAVVLRPGKTPGGVEVRAHLRRLIRHIRTRWHNTRITFRGDGRYARPEAMAWCETNGIDYIFGLSGTKPLARKVDEAADDIRTRRAIENLPVLRGYTETRHKAKSWDRERRTVARIEATMLGLDIRFVVTSLDVGSAEWIYDSLYCARGQAENLIKLHKTQLASDRTSCRSALANQVRLVLDTAAYWLMLTVRDAIPKARELATAEFATLRLRLLKLAARVVETTSRIRLAFAAACPEADLIRGLPGALLPLGP